jgi:hypothetical protein
MLLNLFGPLKKNFILVHLLSRLVKVGKKKLNLLLMFPSKSGNIKLTHTIPPLEELKRRAYCKFHNSFSHAINDCNDADMATMLMSMRGAWIREDGVQQGFPSQEGGQKLIRFESPWWRPKAI